MNEIKRMTKEMVKENLFTNLVYITMENGRTMSLTEKEIILEVVLVIVNVFLIKVSLKITKSMVKEV